MTKETNAHDDHCGALALNAALAEAARENVTLLGVPARAPLPRPRYVTERPLPTPTLATVNVGRPHAAKATRRQSPTTTAVVVAADGLPADRAHLPEETRVRFRAVRRGDVTVTAADGTVTVQRPRGARNANDRGRAGHAARIRALEAAAEAARSHGPTTAEVARKRAEERARLVAPVRMGDFE